MEGNGVQADTVALDSIEGVVIGIRHLVERGHRRIAMLTMPCPEVSPRRDRVEGYRQGWWNKESLMTRA